MLNGIGASFNVSWPPMLSQLLAWLAILELDIPTVMPLSCLLPINFHTSLVSQTAVPLGLVALLLTASHLLVRRRRPQ